MTDPRFTDNPTLIDGLNPRHAAILAAGVRGGDGPTAVADTAAGFIGQLIERRDAVQADIDAMIATAERESRTRFEEAEETRLAELMAEHGTLVQRIADLEAYAERSRESAVSAERLERATQVHIRSEPMTYERHNVRSSFLLDMARTRFLGDGDAGARLARHRSEIDVELREGGRLHRLERDRARQFGRFVEELRQETGREVTLERRDADRTDATSVGDFVPPIWLMELYADSPRAGRPFADAVRNLPLPGGTDQINIPKITTGTAVAAQTADNAGVNEQDMVTNVAQAPVRTIAGQFDVALQVLEQSPIAFDEVVFLDLAADYDAKLDLQTLNGSGSSGQLKGALNATGITTVTYTDASPTVPELWPKFVDAANQSGTNRKLPPTLSVGHWRRVQWMFAALDANNRPLLASAMVGPQNALGVLPGGGQQGLEPNGVTAWMPNGLPFMSDLNMPTNLGGGTNEDRIITLRPFDQLLFEGALRTRVLQEVLSGTLTVRFQAYAYVAFTAERYPSGIAVVAGTGLATPTF